MKKVLTIYFSRTGNSKAAAEAIAAAAGGDLFQVETVEAYSEIYQECVQRAVAEWKSDARPQIQAIPENVAAYDMVIICYPLWCGTMPMCMYTLLEQLDLSGKKVLALCTNEGSGLANSVTDLKKLCPGADIASAMEAKGSKLADSLDAIVNWVKDAL